MTFDKQVKEAKEKQLQYRIIRDAVFILLGLTFLAVSIFLSIKENNNNQNQKVNTTIKK